MAGQVLGDTMVLHCGVSKSIAGEIAQLVHMVWSGYDFYEHSVVFENALEFGVICRREHIQDNIDGMISDRHVRQVCHKPALGTTATSGAADGVLDDINADACAAESR